MNRLEKLYNNYNSENDYNGMGQAIADAVLERCRGDFNKVKKWAFLTRIKGILETKTEYKPRQSFN